MSPLNRFAAFVASVLLSAAAAEPGRADTAEIGVASSVKNDVRGALEGAVRDLASGDGVLAEERISTGAESAAQLLFLDNTSVTLGPLAELTLNRFVYDPDRGNTEVVVGAAKGAFRFVSGLAGPGGHAIETPRARAGIRGSIVEGYVDPLTREEAIVLVQGVVEVCPRPLVRAENCKTLSKEGTFIYVDAKGRLIGPKTWRGPLLTQNSDIDFVEFIREHAQDTDPLRRPDRGLGPGPLSPFFFGGP